jgi:monoamine oxidase
MTGVPQDSEPKTFDSIIIGAGAAGLAAARRLCAAGLSVAIVEARDSIGGRIRSLRLPGWPIVIEAGAEFIHGQPEEIWARIRQANLPVREVSGEEWKWDAGRLQPFEFEKLWSVVFRRLEKMASDEQSFADFLDQHCADLTMAERAQAIAYVEGFNAADSRIINSRWIVEADRASGQASAGGFYRIPEGYDRLLEGLPDAPGAVPPVVRTGCVVSEIHWRPGQVRVELKSNGGLPLAPLSASRAVLTVPLGVLVAAPGSPGAIRFVPDLPEKWRGVNPLRMGSVVKLVVRFRKAFWEEAGLADLGFLHAADETFPTWWTTHPARFPILIGWAGGRAATRLAGLAAGSILNQATGSLARIFSLAAPHLANLVEGWHVTDWGAEPFARGAYSYVGVGGLSAPRKLAEPVAGTLFFAGEATHEHLNGTVGGALATGRRAADELLHSASRSPAEHQ